MKPVRRFFLTVSIILVGLILTLPAHAGPYTVDLTKCIIESTTKTDREEFVKWMFSAISMHPAVKSLSSVSEEQMRDANEKVAKLLMRLLTESCRVKAGKSIKYEGQIAIQTSFQILGQVAAQELFTNQDVAAVMADLEKYLDGDKLKSSLGIK
jgi:hypothetical protein